MTLQDALPLIIIVVNAAVTALLGYLHVTNKASVDAVTKSVDDLVTQGAAIAATQQSHAVALAAMGALPANPIQKQETK
jgi:hypothetical protein